MFLPSQRVSDKRAEAKIHDEQRDGENGDLLGDTKVSCEASFCGRRLRGIGLLARQGDAGGDSQSRRNM